jgi:choline dehydrogenase-like flavoprotein
LELTGIAVQFHLNGFEPGDPEISDPAERYPDSGAQGDVPEEVDVLIVGCGPAGLTLAAQLSAFPDIKTCIVEQKRRGLRRGEEEGRADHAVAFCIRKTPIVNTKMKPTAHNIGMRRNFDVFDGIAETRVFADTEQHHFRSVGPPDPQQRHLTARQNPAEPFG